MITETRCLSTINSKDFLTEESLLFFFGQVSLKTAFGYFLSKKLRKETLLHLPCANSSHQKPLKQNCLIKYISAVEPGYFSGLDFNPFLNKNIWG